MPNPSQNPSQQSYQQPGQQKQPDQYGPYSNKVKPGDKPNAEKEEGEGGAPKGEKDSSDSSRRAS